MERGNNKGIDWLYDFVSVPNKIEFSIRNTGYTKIIALPTANIETKFISLLINLQLLEHNNKERIKKLIRCYAYDGK